MYYVLSFFFLSLTHLQARHRLSQMPLLSIKYPCGCVIPQKIFRLCVLDPKHVDCKLFTNFCKTLLLKEAPIRTFLVVQLYRLLHFLQGEWAPPLVQKLASCLLCSQNVLKKKKKPLLPVIIHFQLLQSRNSGNYPFALPSCSNQF